MVVLAESAMKRMEAENSQNEQSGAAKSARPPVEPKKDDVEKKQSEDRVPPTLIEADAVNHNYAKHHGGEEGVNLNNPSPLEHIPKPYYPNKPTERMRRVDSQSHSRTF